MDTEYYKGFEPIFGSWSIQRLIGEGSFGKVFEIEKNELGIKFRSALKAITIPQSESDVNSARADGMDDESISLYYKSFVEDFSKECSIMSQLKGHTNIVSFEDTQIIEHKDSIGWDIFIRMELLTPLNNHLRSINSSMTRNDVIKLGIDLCNALVLCEKKNIIHRDIKPENIFLSDNGDYKLGDFGISRIAEKTTGASTKVGTKDYMAPEVYRGDQYDHTVDIYSLGLVMYKLLNKNRLPFLPPAPQAITFSQRDNALMKRLSGESFPAASDADNSLNRILNKACAYRPEDRYASASDFLKDLKGLTGESVEADISKLDPIAAVNSATVSQTSGHDEEFEDGETIGRPMPPVMEEVRIAAASNRGKDNVQVTENKNETAIPTQKEDIGDVTVTPSERKKDDPVPSVRPEIKTDTRKDDPVTKDTGIAKSEKTSFSWLIGMPKISSIIVFVLLSIVLSILNYNEGDHMVSDAFMMATLCVIAANLFPAAISAVLSFFAVYLTEISEDSMYSGGIIALFPLALLSAVIAFAFSMFINKIGKGKIWAYPAVSIMFYLFSILTCSCNKIILSFSAFHVFSYNFYEFFESPLGFVFLMVTSIAIGFFCFGLAKMTDKNNGNKKFIYAVVSAVGLAVPIIYIVGAMIVEGYFW
ncbi:MAG: protein kinase [Lachnospiraceae bacterium]|nr:protein kinase [Lachnospiraceae bacterium]